jgi:hypothetical protein
MLCGGDTGDDDDFVFEAIDQGFRELDFGHCFRRGFVGDGETDLK